MTADAIDGYGIGNIKSLTVVSGGLAASDYAKEENDECPRASLYQRTLSTDMMDETFLRRAPRLRRILYRRMPFYLAEALESFMIKKRYDVVISWSDMHALVFAGLQKLSRSKVPHVALMFWISKPKKAFILKHVHTHITTLILWTSTHREFAIKRLGIPPEKIKFIPYYVDQKFFRPMGQESDMICSVGVEMRDYPTFIEAMRGVEIRCHIAAGMARGMLFDTVKAIYREPSLPPNITVGSLPPKDLRALYARSRFVVVPLLPTESDNGLTTILEAMAMGKAVICSRTKGQIDVIIEGKTGIFVPQGDPLALREAIKYLWEHPEVADQMGREGRRRIEEKFTWDQFVNNIRDAAVETVNKKIKTTSPL
jgi:glycosyltransferase involved in cell wall biosynthesis